MNENLLLFYTGVTRRSDTILDEQKKNIGDRSDILREIKRLAYISRDEVRAGNIDAIGELLHESWKLKKQLASKISNGRIDEMYAAAIKAGAIGGKITGAGGGGFLILYCRYEQQAALRCALHGLQELPFHLEPHGSKVIFNYQR